MIANYFDCTSEFFTVLNSGRIGLWQYNFADCHLTIQGLVCVSSLFGLPGDSLEVHHEQYLSEFCHQADKESIRTAIELMRETGALPPLEHRVWNAQANAWQWVSVFGGRCADPKAAPFVHMGGLQDITARKENAQMAQEIQKAEERFHLLLDASPICCTFWDENYKNFACNQEAPRLFGLADKQEYLSRFPDLSPRFQPEGTPSFECALEKVMAAFETGYQRFEWMHQKLDGEPIPAEIILVRIKHDANYFVAGYTRDLRDVKATLAEMRKTEKKLLLTRHLAEKNAQAKREFLDNMSHEIRTPMNGILGAARLLSKTGLTDEQRGYVDKATESTELLLRIINDILDFSKIEVDKLEMEQIEFSFDAVLHSIADLIIPLALEKNLTMTINSDPDIPSALMGDPTRLKQILFNLASNAVKYTEQGYIKITVAVKRQQDQRARLQFSVADTGMGISAKHTQKLFQPFTQADTSASRRHGGTGLGLAICKRLVRLMSGDIWCESQLGVGSTFTFTAEFNVPPPPQKNLPAAFSAAEDEAEARVAALDAVLAGSRILLVEDNEINQAIALELLHNKGFLVDVAGTGLEALHRLRHTRYDLVLMDIQMPEMDGITATREIRQDARHKNLPILAMTAHATVGDRQLSLDAGMNDHVTKPIDPDALYSAIRTWLKR